MKKSFKNIFLPSLCLIAIISCKKNEASDELKSGNNIKLENISEAREDLIKKAQSQPLTTIALSENNFDFGKINKSKNVEHVYEVTNTGKNPLIISQVKPGCGCTVPDFTKNPVLPGQKGKITLKFDPANFDGRVNKQAEVFANVERTPVVLTFSADIQP